MKSPFGLIARLLRLSGSESTSGTEDAVEPPKPNGSIQTRGFRGKLASIFRRKQQPSNGQSTILVNAEGVQEVLEEGESQMVRSITRLDETVAREIMVPRTDIIAIDADSPLSEVVRTIINHGFSRIPIYEETIDNIVGVIYAKDLLRLWGERNPQIELRELARKTHFIPETKRIDELLQEFRVKRVHMAVVVDEYGGVAGLVSLEDLMEEIVGEIEDEFDVGRTQIETVSPTEVVMDGGVGIDQLNDRFSLGIEGQDFDTIGGFILARLGKIPNPGDEIQEDGFRISVLSTTGRRVRKVKITQVPPVQEDEKPGK